GEDASGGLTSLLRTRLLDGCQPRITSPLRFICGIAYVCARPSRRHLRWGARPDALEIQVDRPEGQRRLELQQQSLRVVRQPQLGLPFGEDVRGGDLRSDHERAERARG